MRSFTDSAGQAWVADAREEQTPRHHTRFFLVFRKEGESDLEHPMPEVRWQTLATAERTIQSMSVFELRKRLGTASKRHGGPIGTAKA